MLFLCQMKKVITVFAFVIVAIAAFAQNNTEPAYKRFPTLPPLKILLTDSTTWYTKANIPAKKATMIMVFDPECDHCQHETEEIVKNIDKFKDITIVMASPAQLFKIKSFYAKYNLKRFKNIVMGRDTGFVLPTFYKLSNLPFLAFYNKKGDLIDVFEGNLSIPKILEKFK